MTNFPAACVQSALKYCPLANFLHGFLVEFTCCPKNKSYISSPNWPPAIFSYNRVELYVAQTIPKNVKDKTSEL